MSHRRQQLESSLQRAVAKVLSTGLADPRISGLISVTAVSVSPDLHNATIHVSILPEDRQRATISGLRHAAGHIQSLVGKEMRTRTLPQLAFVLDDSLKKQAQILTAIRQVVGDEEDTQRLGPEPGPGSQADAPSPDSPGNAEDRTS
jgi:ribosome-binding factor A